MVNAVAVGVGNVSFWLMMKCFRSGIAKNTPKKPEQVVKAISLPKSAWGSSDRRFKRYMAGIADTNRIPSPPEAVAAVWTVQFSFGPKSPPKSLPRRPLSGMAREKGFRMAKPKIAPKS